MQKTKGKRQHIMEIARTGILDKGFDATSIEEIVAAADITKGGFYYHFPDKNALARALLEDYIADTDDLLDRLFGRAADLSEDPLERVLIGLQLFAEAYDSMEHGHPGCLIAAAAYQDRLFDASVRNLYRDAMLRWRAKFRTYLEEVAKVYPPKVKVDFDELGDLLCTTAQGGIVLSRAIDNWKIAPAQIRLLRTHIRLMFSDVPGAR